MEQETLLVTSTHTNKQANCSSPVRPIDDSHSSLAHASNILSDWAERVIEEVPRMPDEEIIETARTASELERQAFRVRGACAAELKRRIRSRARTNDRRVIGQQMAKLAVEVGVSASTLDDDARIHEEFGGSDDFRGATEIPREFYRLSLNAPDPHGALNMGARKLAANAAYSTRDFRRDVAELNAGHPEEQVEELHWVTLGLDAGAWADLQTLKARFGNDVLTTVKLALRAMACSGGAQ